MPRANRQNDDRVSAKMIKVAIIEDDDWIRENLAAQINQTPGLNCVSHYRNGQEALEKIVQAAPDVVLIEEAMPPSTAASLGQMGYRVKTVPELGAVSTIAIAPGELRGAFDPRKGGGAAGD